MVNGFNSIDFLSRKISSYAMFALLAFSSTALPNAAKAMQNPLEDAGKTVAVKAQSIKAPLALTSVEDLSKAVEPYFCFVSMDENNLKAAGKTMAVKAQSITAPLALTRVEEFSKTVKPYFYFISMDENHLRAAGKMAVKSQSITAPLALTRVEETGVDFFLDNNRLEEDLHHFLYSRHINLFLKNETEAKIAGETMAVKGHSIAAPLTLIRNTMG